MGTIRKACNVPAGDAFRGRRGITTGIRIEKGRAMSSNQKWLKIMSFIAILAGVGMAVWTSVSLAFANTAPGLLLAICMGAQAFLDVALGVFGIGAANKPVRSEGLYYIATVWLALILNVAAVIVIAFIGGGGEMDSTAYAIVSLDIPSVINLVVVFFYARFARLVRVQSAQSL